MQSIITHFYVLVHKQIELDVIKHHVKYSAMQKYEWDEALGMMSIPCFKGNTNEE